VGRISSRFSISIGTDSAIPIEHPIDSSTCSSAVCPNECAHGRKLQLTSPVPIGKIWCTALMFDTKLPWLSTTPFGLPVVPDV
jgi:hypothetical protein